MLIRFNCLFAVDLDTKKAPEPPGSGAASDTSGRPLPRGWHCRHGGLRYWREFSEA